MGGDSKAHALTLAILLVLTLPGTVAATADSSPPADVTSRESAPEMKPVLRPPTTGLSDQCPTGTPDPPTDRIGWENGCWATDTLSLTPHDRVNQSELRMLLARTQARLETLRTREFRHQLDITVVPRSTIVSNRSATVSSTQRTRTNLRYEALFVVNESTDAVRDPATRYAAYYAPRKQTIVVVSEANRTVKPNEFLLAHELAHALQDDYNNLPNDTRRTRWDGQTAATALVEGVANYLTQAYKARCQGAWNGTCFPPERWSPNAESTPGGWCEAEDPPFNIGRAHLDAFVYSDGPVFVDRLRDRDGWAAVEAAYDSPPVSTEQVIHPRAYPSDVPTDVQLRDQSHTAWRPVVPDDTDAVTLALGEVSLYVMFWNQWFLTDHRAAIIPCRQTYRTTHPRDAHNYSHPVTTGWDGDRLLPYVDRTSNETGYVWKITWDTRADAREFATAYRRLLRGHGATQLENTSIYRIPSSSGYTDAFALQVRSTTVIITNAPTVTDLPEIRPSLSQDPASSNTDTGRVIVLVAALLTIGGTVAVLYGRRYYV